MSFKIVPFAVSMLRSAVHAKLHIPCIGSLGRPKTVWRQISSLLTTPVVDGFRAPAEWEPHAACIMGWPAPKRDVWPRSGILALVNVIKTICRSEKVLLLANPGKLKCVVGIQFKPLILVVPIGKKRVRDYSLVTESNSFSFKLVLS